MADKAFKSRSILTDKPEFLLGTPLDKFFVKVDTELLQKVATFSDDTSFKGTLYEYLGYKDNQSFIQYLIFLFQELHVLIKQKQDDLLKENNNLLPISLHDMRYMDQLSALLIVHGIDANINPKLRILVELRRLNSFKRDDKTFIIPKDHVPNFNALKNVLKFLYEVITTEETNDYLKSIIVKGPIFTNLYLGFLQLHITYPLENEFFERLNIVEDCQDTYSLFTLYTFLTQCIELTDGKLYILDKLTTLPIRRDTDGLISLIDFILGVREDEQIDNEKLQRVNKIILSKPKNISNKLYLTKIFNQIYDGMSYVNRPVLINCLNGIVTEFFYKNKKIVRDFLFKRIYEVLFNAPTEDHDVKELNDMFNVLISLSKNISTDLIVDLTTGLDEKGFFLNIWIYCLFLLRNQKVDPLIANALKKENNSPYHEVILSLLQTFIIITENYSILDEISLNLLNFNHELWEYRIDLETQLPYIAKKTDDDKRHDNIIDSLTKQKEDKMETMSKLFSDMDLAVDLFMNLLNLINNAEVITTIFLSILSRWIQNTSTSEQTIIDGEDMSKNLLIIIDLKILQKMNQDFKTDLVKNKKDVLVMIAKLLDFVNVKGTLEEEDEDVDDTTTTKEEVDSDDEDNEVDETSEIPSTALQIIIELLQLILSEPLQSNNDEINQLLIDINKKLGQQPNQPSIIADIKNKITKYVFNENVFRKDNNNDEKSDISNDQETLNRALINLSDNLAPIRVHGLTELRQLIMKQTKIISIERVIQIHLTNLKNSDPFVYLSAIKGLVSLTETSPRETLSVLLDFYNNDKKRNKVDDILRIGEVIVNYIQRENKLFQGEIANKIIDICLGKIREHDKLDNRLRMSAMSILGVCLQVNALGVKPRIREMLDCVFGILVMESGKNNNKPTTSFVMRRSAVHLVHDLLYNADMSLFPPEYNLTKIKTLLEYTKSQDDDYLVCEQITQLLDILNDFHVSDPVSKLTELD
ncbi:RNA polymerase II assembly factor Rtp1p [Monosporozyma unispora]